MGVEKKEEPRRLIPSRRFTFYEARFASPIHRIAHGLRDRSSGLVDDPRYICGKVRCYTISAVSRVLGAPSEQFVGA